MDGHAYRDRIVSELGDIATSDGTQGASSGSFAFTESDIRRVITNWLDIADSYRDSLSKAQLATFIGGPGLDYASEAFATKANQSGDALLRHLRHGQEYSLQQAQLAQNALDDYLGVERTNVMELFNAQQGPRTEV